MVYAYQTSFACLACFARSGERDWLDITFVEGFNYPVQIEVVEAGSVVQSSPTKVACQHPSFKDSFMLCDTALTNVEGGAPNWKYPSNSGLM